MHVFHRAALLLGILVLPATPAVGQEVLLDPDIVAARTGRTQAMAAFQAQDKATALETMSAAADLWPTHTRLRFAVAQLALMTGKTETAMTALARYLQLGQVIDPSLPLFDAVRDDPGFAALARTSALNAHPLGLPVTEIEFSDDHQLCEGVARDMTNGRLFLGCVVSRAIFYRDEDGEAAPFVAAGRAGLASVFGLRVDVKRGLLWAATSVVDVTPLRDGDVPGSAAIMAFDLATGVTRHRYAAPGEGPHVIGDLTLSPDGTIYATDSLQPVIYRLSPGADGLEAWVKSPAFVSPQGLVLSADGETLYVADYANGLFTIDVTTGSGRLIDQPDDVDLTTIDGLYRAGDTLIAVQNGLSQHRVLALEVDGSRISTARVLAAGLAAFDEPTLGFVEGRRFYLLANSQWPKFAPGGVVKEGASVTGPRVISLPIDPE